MVGPSAQVKGLLQKGHGYGRVGVAANDGSCLCVAANDSSSLCNSCLIFFFFLRRIGIRIIVDSEAEEEIQEI